MNSGHLALPQHLPGSATAGVGTLRFTKVCMIPGSMILLYTLLQSVCKLSTVGFQWLSHMLINDHPSSTVDLDKTLSQLIGSALWHLTCGALVLLVCRGLKDDENSKDFYLPLGLRWPSSCKRNEVVLRCFKLLHYNWMMWGVSTLTCTSWRSVIVVSIKFMYIPHLCGIMRSAMSKHSKLQMHESSGWETRCWQEGMILVHILDYISLIKWQQHPMKKLNSDVSTSTDTFLDRLFKFSFESGHPWTSLLFK